MMAMVVEWRAKEKKKKKKRENKKNSLHNN
jgi:hypothetical protein